MHGNVQNGSYTSTIKSGLPQQFYSDRTCGSYALVTVTYLPRQLAFHTGVNTIISLRLTSLSLPLIIGLQFGLPAFATDYYVSNSGNDKSNGLSAMTAWATLTKIQNTNFSPGDRILLNATSTFSGMLYLDNFDAGTPSSPVTVTSYGTGRATISAGSGMGVFIYNTGGIKISNIKIVGSGYPSNNTNGIVFYMEVPGNVKLDTVQIDSVEVSGFGGFGITVTSWNQKSGFKNVSITNAVSHDNGSGGIAVSGYWDPNSTLYSHQNVYVGHCTAYNNLGISGTSHSSGNGITISDVDGGTIERSLAYNNGALNTANGGPVGIVAWDSNNITVQYNESHDNHTGSVTDGGGFDLDGGTTNSVMQYNYSHNNDGPGFLFAEFTGARPMYSNTIRYNITQNDGRNNGPGGIHLWNGGSGISNAEVYNNTVFMTPGPSRNTSAITIGSPTINTQIRNNILMAYNNSWAFWAEPGQSGLVMQDNDYWTGGGYLMIGLANSYYYDLPSFRAGTGQEQVNGANTGFNVDPMLNNPGGGWSINNSDALNTLTPYQFQSGSPLIDSGLNLWNFGVNPGSNDFYGGVTPQGAGYDLGAAETHR